MSFDFKDWANENDGFINLLSHGVGAKQRNRANDLHEKQNQLHEQQIQLLRESQQETQKERAHEEFLEQCQTLIFNLGKKYEEVGEQLQMHPVEGYRRLYFLQRVIQESQITPEIFTSLEWKEYCYQVLNNIEELAQWAEINVSEEYRRVAMQLILDEQFELERQEKEKQYRKMQFEAKRIEADQSAAARSAIVALWLSFIPVINFAGLMLAWNTYNKDPDGRSKEYLFLALMINIIWISVFVGFLYVASSMVFSRF